MNTRPFSKLKKVINGLFDEKLKMDFCCISYPIRGQWKSSNAIPRFYVKLGKEIIWDVPKDIPKGFYEIWTFSSGNGIAGLVRDYIDTPVDKLLRKKFKKDRYEVINQYLWDNYQEVTGFDYKLVEIFIAADRRLGREALLKWAEKKQNPIVDKILAKRFS